jgi:hypothetical protein
MTALCNRGILLKGGTVVRDGQMSMVAAEYFADRSNLAGFAHLGGRLDRSGTGDARFQSLELLCRDERRRTFAIAESFSQKIRVATTRRIGTALVSTTIRSSDGTPVYCLMNIDSGCEWIAETGEYEFMVTIDQLSLYPGTYSIDLWLGDRNEYRIDYVTDALTFTVVQGPHCRLERNLEGASGLVHQPAAWSQVKR